jgi:hypothetical protein
MSLRGLTRRNDAIRHKNTPKFDTSSVLKNFPRLSLERHPVISYKLPALREVDGVCS